MANDTKQGSGDWWIVSLWDNYFPVLLTIVVGVIFSVGVFFVIRWWETRDIATAFKLHARERTDAVKNSFQIELGMLKLYTAALMEDGIVEKGEFEDLLKPFGSDDNNIEAIEWLPRVPKEKRREFEAAAQKEGFKDFQISETDKNGMIVPVGERDEYFPIYYCGPNLAAPGIMGYDVGSEAVRFECLKDARDCGVATASGRITFIQDANNAGGFLIVLPVYEKGKPTTSVEERRTYLKGFILGLYRATVLLDAAVDKLSFQGINVGLFDASTVHSGGHVDFRRSRMDDTQWNQVDVRNVDVQKQLYYSDRLNVGGHPWTIACLSSPIFEANRRTWWPLGMMLVGLAFTGMLGTHLASSANRNAKLEDKVREKTADVRHAQEEVICKLVSASQWCDEETGMHIRRTGLLSEALARAAGWYGDDVDAIRQAAPMHDIGKIGIPDAILKKPGKLTPEEFEVMKTHSRIGAAILAGSTVPMLKMAKDIALNHHERWDGRGYPYGSAGKAIPEDARIVAVVDVYDALMHDRVYRPAMPEAEVMKIMRLEGGKHFEPTLLAAFFRCLPELRRILKEHPDEVLKDKETLTSFLPSLPSKSSSKRPSPGVVFPTMPGPSPDVPLGT